MKLLNKLKHAWNAFNEEDRFLTKTTGSASSSPPHRANVMYNPKGHVASIFNRIAMDVSMTGFRHVKIDAETEDITDINSGLNYCLNTEANIDQTHIQFIHDMVYSMFDEGVVAVVPVETTINPEFSGSYDINSMRVGKIVTWFPKHVEVELYNDEVGMNQRITIAKSNVAILENPLYSVINDRNSTLKRLIAKLNKLDEMEANGSMGRLDLLISVPYAVKTKTQEQQALKRISDIEYQLAHGKNGIAYIDGTEKVTQLNRPANDQLLESVRDLTKQFYNQIGMTENVFNGTANETELRTYYNRAVDPIVECIVAEFRRKFITKTARTQGHTIMHYRDMFKTVSVENIAKLGDVLRRNSIATANEMRKIIGMKPSNDPEADKLFNPNIADKNQDGGHSPRLTKEEPPVVSTEEEAL